MADIEKKLEQFHEDYFSPYSALGVMELVDLLSDSYLIQKVNAIEIVKAGALYELCERLHDTNCLLNEIATNRIQSHPIAAKEKEKEKEEK